MVTGITDLSTYLMSLYHQLQPSVLATILSMYPDTYASEDARFAALANDGFFYCQIEPILRSIGTNAYSYLFSVPPAIHTT